MDKIYDEKTMYYQLDMKDAEESPLTIYKDGHIAILNWTGNVIKETDVLKSNIFILISCLKGRMQIDVNEKTRVIHAHDILFCYPNYMISHYIASPDFEGKLICFTQKSFLIHIHIDNDLWEKAFLIDKNPIIHLVDRPALFELYEQLITLTVEANDRPYRMEVIGSIIRSMIYVLLAEVEKSSQPMGSDSLTQGDLLFKRFIELLSTNEVKPRFVKWYGERLCVTPKYLSTVCKRVSGKTASEWIDQYVVMDISRLLKYSNKSIKEISDYLNFPNMSFFGKYVRAHLGSSPKNCRQILRENKVF